jgi:PilZ domain
METAPTAVVERRLAPRRQPAMGTVFRRGGSTPGLVWNISTGGLSLLVADPPERGATVQGTLATADGKTQPVAFVVTHVSQLRTGDYVIGGPFDRALEPDEIRPFVAEA